MRSEELYLYDIIVAADAVMDYIRGVSWERFSSEPRMRDAIIHKLQIIGEAVSRLPPI
ncbi:MAG: DUF86 domain-containing protein [bacterium]|nr:DUF86 domain-containing protein [bacterium]